MVNGSDEFELKFPKLSQAELKGFLAESSRAEHFNIRAETELTNFRLQPQSNSPIFDY